MATPADRLAELVSASTRDLGVPVSLERENAVADVPADLVIPHPTGSPIEKLVVRANNDGDIDVEVHVPGRSGSPFVQHYPGSEDPDLLPAVARFVSDSLHGRTVLAMRKGWMRGGREFLDRAELRRRGPVRYAWTVSWPGNPPGALEQEGMAADRRGPEARARPPTRIVLGAAGMLIAGVWHR